MRLLFIILLLSLKSSAASWYVDNAAGGANNGTSWTDAWTSFAGISWAGISAGDTIYISGGATSKTYNERFTSGKAGTVGNPIMIKTGAAEPSPNANHDGDITITRSYSTSDVNQNHFYISHANVYVDGSDGNGTIKMTAKDGYIGFRSDNGVHGLTCRYITFTNVAAPVWISFGGTNMLIEHTRGYGTLGGISVTVRSVGFGANTIRHNWFETDDGDGIVVDSGTDIYGNYGALTNSSIVAHPDGIVCQGNNNRVYNNRIGGFNQGIYLDTLYDFPATNYVWGNVVYVDPRGDTNFATSLIVHGEWGQGNVHAYNNTFQRNIRLAVSIGDAFISNNICHYITDDGATITGTASVNKNRYHTDEGTAFFKWGGVFYGDNYASYVSGSGNDAASTRGSGGFVDFDNGDLGITSSSAAVDSGGTLGSTYATGLSNNATWGNPPTVSRPQGAAWDLGAYEYVSGGGGGGETTPGKGRGQKGTGGRGRRR